MTSGRAEENKELVRPRRRRRKREHWAVRDDLSMLRQLGAL